MLAQHLARLKHDCEALKISFRHWQALQQRLAATASKQPERCVIKAIVSRGAGGRGYAPIDTVDPDAFIRVSAFPSHYGDWQTEGVALNVSPIKLARQPMLAGLKHLNRLEQVMIKQALADTPEQDALVLDTEGFIIETSAANVFWRNQGKWMTPMLDKTGVSGIMRNQIMASMSRLSLEVEEVRCTVSELKGAEAMFMCNALMQIVPVNSLVLQRESHLLFDRARVSELQNKLDKIES